MNQPTLGRPLISVVVPIYGIDKYLGICIESLLNQTYKNLEIILVDDGSKDRCPEICDLYARKDGRIKVIHKTNGGLVSARKAGVLASTGKYIGYVDGDDWVGPGFYESLYASIEASGSDVVCAGFSRDLFGVSAHFQNNIPAGLYEGETLDVLRKEMMSYGKFFRIGITTYVWNKLFRREILLEHQLSVDNNITIGEDAAVTYPVIMDCKKVCVIDNCAYHYRQREDSMLKNVSSFEQDAQKLKALHSYLSSFASKCHLEFDMQRQVDDFVLGICIMRSGDLSFFNKPLDNSKLVIFSAGTFGQQLMNRLKERDVCHISGWLDDDFWEYRRCCLDVDPVEEITKLDYDYILIATLDNTIANNIRIRLMDYGVPPSKLLSIVLPDEPTGRIISKYF